MHDPKKYPEVVGIRDYFAIRIAGPLAVDALKYIRDSEEILSDDQVAAVVAETAYQFADAMLRERMKIR